MTPADMPPDADCDAPVWVCFIEEDASDRMAMASKLARSVRTTSGSTIGEVVDRHTFRRDPIVSFATNLPSTGMVPSGVTLRST